MRSSSKSRNRGRNANRRGNNGGSVINRVFDSAGPEGKVRGTPQQIIDKYNSLAHDSQLSGDRVSAENFNNMLSIIKEYYRMLKRKLQRNKLILLVQILIILINQILFHKIIQIQKTKTVNLKKT